VKNKHRGELSIFSFISRITYRIGAIIFAIVFMATFVAPVAHAVQTVPYKMNFQGRLTDSTGTIMPDGLYNMTFRIYDAATAGTLQWSELREVGNRVQVTNGLFSTQLGDVTSLPPGIFTNQNLYFEIELPTPATATCSTSACASYTEGPMTPRNKLATSAYAFNADQIDGIDGSSLARNDTANTFSVANTFNGDVAVGSTNSATKFVVNDNSGAALLTADTTATVVKIGSPAAATLASVRLLTTSAEFNGTVRIGTATNGVDISSSGIIKSGTARSTKRITLTAEYAGAVLDAGSGANNTGTMISGVNLTSRMNYYKWSTTQATNQNYDVVAQVPIPKDFDGFTTTNPIRISTYSSDLTNGTVQFELRDSTNTVIQNFVSITPTATLTWQAMDPGTVTGTYTPGDYMTIRIRLQSPLNGDTRVGNIYMDYFSKF
jgi:hypothetical protein